MKSSFLEDLSSVIAQCDCKYGNSGFCSHVCSILYRLASYQTLKNLIFSSDEDFSSTIGACSWRAQKPNNMGNMSATEMNWIVHHRSSSSKSTIFVIAHYFERTSFIRPVHQIFVSPPESNILKQLKISL